MNIDIKTTTLEEAVKAAQKSGFQYIRTSGLSNSYIEDFLDDLAQDEETEGFDDYARVNNIIFRLSEIGSDDAELYELN